MDMKLNRSMQKDRSGISTILIIVIVLVAIIAASAAYIVLKDDEEKDTIAPGTTMSYDITVTGLITGTGTIEVTVVGQSADDYFVKVVTKLESPQRPIDSTAYSLSSKAAPKDAKKVGTVQMDTIDGEKKLTIWEYTKDGVAVKLYADQTTGISYKEELSVPECTEVHVLNAYNMKKQTSYKESESIGKTSKYMLTFSGYEWAVDMKCVADGESGQYGVVYDFSNLTALKMYFLCDSLSGLPTDAVYKRMSVYAIHTVDGDMILQEFEFNSSADEKWTFYYDPESDTVYEIIIEQGGVKMSLDLVRAR